MQNQERCAWIVVLLGSVAVTCVMFHFMKSVTGSFLPAVLPEIETDAIYYLVQVQEVLDGHPMLGNPYIIEHVGDRFPGLILPIWIAALPGFLGMGINAVFAVNALLYSLLLGSLLFMICNKLNNKRVWVSAGIAILGTASLHNLMIRPAIMQIVYPAFALFTLALIQVLDAPKEKKPYVYLWLTTALSFYVYPYLWMITFTTVGLLGIMFLSQRNRQACKNLAITSLGIAIVCIPQIVLTAYLMSDPLGQELHARIGLVHTHLIHPNAILFAKYTILIVIGLSMLRMLRGLQNAERVVLLIAVALLIATFSNVITGKEMHFDTHFWRIGMFVSIIAVPVFWEAARRSSVQRTVAIVCLAALLLTIVNRVAIRAGAYAYLKQQEITRQRERDIQEYTAVFAYFNNEHIEDKVIMTTSSLSPYIPLYTKNYIFFYGPARSNMISNAELLDRFLLQYIDFIDAQYIVDNMVSYIGWQPEREAALRRAYGETIQPIDILGGTDYIDALLTRKNEMERSYDALLGAYRLDYVVIDALSKENPRVPAGSKELYRTDRFTIYAL